VYEALTALTKEGGISTEELALHLGLLRANVSADLNRLCEEGRASKTGTKPVLYRGIPARAVPKQSVLDLLAQQAPSLTQVVEQGKAAVLYPPSGMPMLLLGETGVGKSMFAGLVHEYAIEVGRKKKDSPFVIFNCADYANNPQLLVSYLFGTRKGAFTGADTDRAGLLERADGGILFLDEVHRLPPEGQEMLFTFFDRGCFRRLGDPDTERYADVLIIAATTESPASALLNTFARRIPMTLHIPCLAERSLEERLPLVRHFFADESRRLGKPIYVTINAVRALVGYRCPGNIGQLKSDIQLLCAKAYSDLVLQLKPRIEVSTADLPMPIKSGLVSETSHRKIWALLPDLGRHFLCFGEEKEEESGPASTPTGQSIYDFIDTRTIDLRAQGLREEEIGQQLTSAIKTFFADSCGGASGGTNRMREFLGKELELAITEMLDLAQARLRRKISAPIANGLAIHVANSIRRVKAGKKIKNPEFERIRKEHPEEFGAAVECLRIIDRVFDVSLPLEESSFIATFFTLEAEGFAPRRRPSVIVMTHGESTASSMAKTCNDLLGEDVVIGIDVRLDRNPQEAYSDLCARVGEDPSPTALILLVDMGSLTNFGADLRRDFGIDVRTVNLVSTLHVLQAARMSLQGRGIDEIYDKVRKISDEGTQSGLKPVAGENAAIQRGCIATLCTTGEGTAAFIKAKLDDCFSANKILVEVVALNVSSLDDAQLSLDDLQRRNGRVFCVVSPFKLGLAYKEFGIEDVVDQKRLAVIQSYVESELLFEKIVEAHRETITAVDPRSALESARSFVATVEKGLGCILLSGPSIGILCHVAAMIDRSAHGESCPPFKESAGFLAANASTAALIRKELETIERKFAIKVTTSELCYLISFFNPVNCDQSDINGKSHPQTLPTVSIETGFSTE